MIDRGVMTTNFEGIITAFGKIKDFVIFWNILSIGLIILGVAWMPTNELASLPMAIGTFMFFIGVIPSLLYLFAAATKPYLKL